MLGCLSLTESHHLLFGFPESNSHSRVYGYLQKGSTPAVSAGQESSLNGGFGRAGILRPGRPAEQKLSRAGPLKNKKAAAQRHWLLTGSCNLRSPSLSAELTPASQGRQVLESAVRAQGRQLSSKQASRADNMTLRIVPSDYLPRAYPISAPVCWLEQNTQVAALQKLHS